MPAKPLTPQQKEDAARLKEAFKAWQQMQRQAGTPVSQIDAAHRLGFGQSALNQYLNGQIPLNGPVLTKFGELLGVKPEEISPAIAAQEVERSHFWAPTHSALEQLAVQAFALHGIKAHAISPRTPKDQLPGWTFMSEMGHHYIPDLKLEMPDGSSAWVEVKATRSLKDLPPHMVKVQAEHPRDFLLLMADAPDLPRVVSNWLKRRDEPEAAAVLEPERHRLRNVRPVWVVGMTQGGMPARIWSDGDHPVGSTDEYADVSTSDPHAFACRVVGDSMVPRYMPGEYALVEPDTVPELEDDVLVRLATGETLLKRLLSRRSGIRLGSYNTTEVLSFREEEITWMYYVAHPIPVRRIKQRLDSWYREPALLRKQREMRSDASRPADSHLGGDSALGGLEEPKAPKRRVDFGRGKK